MYLLVYSVYYYCPLFKLYNKTVSHSYSEGSDPIPAPYWHRTIPCCDSFAALRSRADIIRREFGTKNCYVYSLAVPLFMASAVTTANKAEVRPQTVFWWLITEIGGGNCFCQTAMIRFGASKVASSSFTMYSFTISKVWQNSKGKSQCKT